MIVVRLDMKAFEHCSELWINFNKATVNVSLLGGQNIPLYQSRVDFQKSSTLWPHGWLWQQLEHLVFPTYTMGNLCVVWIYFMISAISQWIVKDTITHYLWSIYRCCIWERFAGSCLVSNYTDITICRWHCIYLPPTLHSNTKLSTHFKINSDGQQFVCKRWYLMLFKHG